jgi:hypothetical protein
MPRQFFVENILSHFDRYGTSNAFMLEIFHCLVSVQNVEFRKLSVLPWSGKILKPTRLCSLAADKFCSWNQLPKYVLDKRKTTLWNITNILFIDVSLKMSYLDKTTSGKRFSQGRIHTVMSFGI